VSVLLVTIGRRDVQYVFDKGDQGYVRMNIPAYYRNSDRSKEIKLDQDLISISKINHEVRGRDKSNCSELEPVGICFPMMEKSLSKAGPGIKGLSKIFILSTDRSGILPHIGEMKSKLDQRNFRSAGQYLDEVERYATEDISALFGGWIEKSLKNRPDLFGLKNVSVRHVPIGKNAPYLSFFNAAGIDRHKKESDVINLIRRADINRSDFFYPECYRALQPYFKEMAGQDIYLSISGGMPMMQRALELIFKAIGIGPQIFSMNIPERDDKKIVTRALTQDYSEYFELFRRFKNALNVFHFNQAWIYLFREMVPFLKQEGNYFGPTIKKIETLQSNADPFKMQYAKLLSAFYREDIIELCILVVSIQEQARDQLLKDFCIRTSGCNHTPYRSDIDKESIEIDGVEYNIRRNDVFASTDITTRDAGLKQYAALMLKNNKQFNKSFFLVKKTRNDYIHTHFIPPDELQKLATKYLYPFLNIRKDSDEVRTKVLNNQIDESVMSFENELMGKGSFMYQIAQMSGRLNGFNFDIRTLTGDILDNLLQCPLG